MNKIAGFLAVATAVLIVIISATLLPDVTVGHESVEPFERQLGVRGEPITYPIPWAVVSTLAIVAGAWRVGWFMRWLGRRDDAS